MVDGLYNYLFPSAAGKENKGDRTVVDADLLYSRPSIPGIW